MNHKQSIEKAKEIAKRNNDDQQGFFSDMFDAIFKGEINHIPIDTRMVEAKKTSLYDEFISKEVAEKYKDGVAF